MSGIAVRQPHTPASRSALCFTASLIPPPPRHMGIYLSFWHWFRNFFYFSPTNVKVFSFALSFLTSSFHKSRSLHLFLSHFTVSLESPPFFPSFVQVGVRRKQRSVNAIVSLKVASSPLSRHGIALSIFLTLLLQ